jgi:hypothetical protein
MPTWPVAGGRASLQYRRTRLRSAAETSPSGHHVSAENLPSVAAAPVHVGSACCVRSVVMRSFLAHRRTIERADSARLSGSSGGCSGAAFCAVVTARTDAERGIGRDRSPPRGELVMTGASGPWRDNEGVSSLSSWAWLHAVRSGSTQW